MFAHLKQHIVLKRLIKTYLRSTFSRIDGSSGTENYPIAPNLENRKTVQKFVNGSLSRNIDPKFDSDIKDSFSSYFFFTLAHLVKSFYFHLSPSTIFFIPVELNRDLLLYFFSVPNGSRFYFFIALIDCLIGELI